PPPTPTCALSLHDALPICRRQRVRAARRGRLRRQGRRRAVPRAHRPPRRRRLALGVRLLLRLAPPRTLGVPRGLLRVAPAGGLGDRKSTRLNSSHVKISYA